VDRTRLGGREETAAVESVTTDSGSAGQRAK
jgi:hypothetical protein